MKKKKKKESGELQNKLEKSLSKNKIEDIGERDKEGKEIAYEENEDDGGGQLKNKCGLFHMGWRHIAPYDSMNQLLIVFNTSTSTSFSFSFTSSIPTFPCISNLMA